ncbi:PREDICTED: uncharacterized protein LOC104822432 [Tarenaya hassleriana]|uniref:uncharacterized protein LOC104822432 n=1 Tax=Tarenaya hassleriana TaxID=28532 RepID=UPI00053C22FE|nr:PREDICTED: uncharacterized protein LOC104822432 [Tarenaya hassleriana]
MVELSVGEQHFVKGRIAQDFRSDGRKRLTYRPIHVETGIIPQDWWNRCSSQCKDLQSNRRTDIRGQRGGEEEFVFRVLSLQIYHRLSVKKEKFVGISTSMGSLLFWTEPVGCLRCCQCH